MDRRQNRTRKAVFHAMVKLLAQKHFERITVQEIIDEADIGRSTFYTHFETKEDLLRSLFDYIFAQLRDEAISEAGGKPSLELRLVQVLKQGKKYRQILQGMYTGEMDAVCREYITDALKELFQEYRAEIHSRVPERFLMHHLTAGFAQTLRWWILEDCPETPEEIVRYYLELTRI